MKQVILYALVFLSYALTAQTPKHRIVSIPVKTGNKQLSFPWTGGMNAPQFSTCDLNNDGVKDLFVFDRAGNTVLTYLNLNNGSDTTYQYAPQYESLFPPSLEQWASIRDYNSDGIPDIFTRAIFYNGQPYVGSRVFKGKMQNGQLAFDVVTPILNYFDGNYNINIWTNVDDIPVYTDVNRDGDIDILTFGIFGAAVEYYENQTIENQGNPSYSIDSFKYALHNTCWGNFTEAGLTNSISLNVSCKGGSDSSPDDGGGSRHTGSTIYNFDADNDHDVDLLIGDVSFNNLVYVQNCGDSSNANMCSWDSLWSSCTTPVTVPIFPAAFGVDADNDGLEDVLVAPNARQGAINYKNVLLYRNTGNSTCPFEYQNDTFLTHHSLDFGTNSKPVFFDFDNDGLKDLIVGNYGYFTPSSSYKSAIAVYKNKGTASSPKYELLFDDYKNYSSSGLLAMHPAFGDLDGDGNEDMLIGDHTGLLHFFKNTGLGQANFPTTPSIPGYFSIDVGQFAAPFIYDVNGDQLNDLIVGKRDGRISYYWNLGTADSAYFHKDSVNSYFGEIRVNRLGYVDGYATPIIVKDSADNLLLYTGSEKGSIYKFMVNPANLRSGSFALIDSNFLNKEVGIESTIAISDLNNDGLNEYVIGNARGGLTVYSETVWDSTALPLAVNLIKDNSLILSIYPIPGKETVMCAIDGIELQNPTVEVYSLLGKLERVNTSVNENKILLNTATLASGFYFIRICNTGKMLTGKFIIE